MGGGGIGGGELDGIQQERFQNLNDSISRFCESTLKLLNESKAMIHQILSSIKLAVCISMH